MNRCSKHVVGSHGGSPVVGGASSGSDPEVPGEAKETLALVLAKTPFEDLVLVVHKTTPTSKMPRSGDFSSSIELLIVCRLAFL